MAGIEIDPPVGDAGGMRTKAGRIGVECADLERAAQKLDARCHAMIYDCSAGDHFRQIVATRRRQLHRALDELRYVQGEMLHEAQRVEAAQAAWARLERKVQAVGGDVGRLERDFMDLLAEL
ncbi:MAG: hypothetical protein ACR2MY_07195 [Candidatus Dormibacteria bacterium]